MIHISKYFNYPPDHERLPPYNQDSRLNAFHKFYQNVIILLAFKCFKEQFVKKRRKSAEFEFLYLDIAIVSPNLVTSTKINDKWKFTQG